MKKFIKNIVLFSSMPIIFSLIIYFIDGSKYVNSFDYALADKRDLLKKKTDKNRIVFIGGSATSFGLYSPLIESRTNHKVINTAIYAGYGMKFNLDYFSSLFKENDIVIVTPEYNQYFEDNFNGVKGALLLPIDADISNLRYLDTKQILEQTADLPSVIIGKTKSIIKYIKNNGAYPEDMKPYLRSSFNQHGDAVGHWGLIYPNLKIDEIIGNYNPEVIHFLEHLQKGLNTKNIKLYVSFPALLDEAYLKNKSKINLVYSKLLNSDIKLIGEPNSYLLPRSFFFDSNYHLTKEGQKIHSQLLVDDFIKQKIISNDTQNLHLYRR